VVVFLVTENLQGCVGCCDPSCSKTPTPVPEYDSLGRRVFHTERGQVVIVIEGMAGDNGTNPGNALGPAPPDNRPDAQVQTTQRLGSGPPGPCNLPGTGVPAINPPSFDPADSNVTDALNDFACRFQVFSRAAPCTYTDASGDAKFVSSNGTIQFCDFMAATASLHSGPSILTAALRDENGVLGPTAQIVVQVATPTPTP
jgi:hypothetical protein